MGTALRFSPSREDLLDSHAEGFRDFPQRLGVGALVPTAQPDDGRLIHPRLGKGPPLAVDQVFEVVSLHDTCKICNLQGCCKFICKGNARLLKVMTCGDRIRQCLQFKWGKRVPWLAKKLEVKHQGLYETLDRAEVPRRIEEIAGILGVPLSWLLTGLPKQPWEKNADPMSLRGTVVDIVARLQGIISDLDRAISQPIVERSAYEDQQAIENRTQQIKSDAPPPAQPGSALSPGKHRPRSPRRPHPRTGAG